MVKKNNDSAGISWPFFFVGLCLMDYAFYMSSKAFDAGTLTGDQRFILLWLLPLASGFLCATFAGKISAKTKKGFAGWAVAATGGFAVWILSFFLLPSPSAVNLPPDGVSISMVQGMPFKKAAEMIAQNDNSVIELIGFVSELKNRKIVKTDLSAENHLRLLENLRLCVDDYESFPIYTVTVEGKGKYVLRIK